MIILEVVICGTFEIYCITHTGCVSIMGTEHWENFIITLLVDIGEVVRVWYRSASQIVSSHLLKMQYTFHTYRQFIGAMSLGHLPLRGN